MKGGGGGRFFALSGAVVGLSSFYQLTAGCRSCEAAATGMPAMWAERLSILGVLFGFSLVALSRPWSPITPLRQRACHSLLLGATAVGTILLLGIVAGIYRPCPTCVLTWTAIAASCLALVAQGGKAAQPMSATLLAVVLAAGWTRFDRTTAQGIADLLPHTDLNSGCVSDVLTQADLRALRVLGVPQGTPVVFVGHCSPCAAATVRRILSKSPETKVVASDTTLIPIVGKQALIVYPPLADRVAKLAANLYRATIRSGEVQQCRSNVSSID